MTTDQHDTTGRHWRPSARWALGVVPISGLLCLLAVAEFTWEVFADDDVVVLDSQIADMVLDIRSEPLTTVMRTITVLADTETILLVTTACLGAALAQRRRRQALGVAVAVFGTTLVVFTLKEVLGRERPPTPHNLTDLVANAYPSGHAAYGVATWGAALWLLTAGASTRMRRAAALLATCLAFAIGLSRVYLGVHWGSDVVAGWAVGGLCLSAGILIGSPRSSTAPDTGP